MINISRLLIMFCIFFFLMIRRPPRVTRTDTLFPYTTLVRSHLSQSVPPTPGQPDKAPMLIPLRIKAFDREGGHGDEAEQLVLLDRAEMAVPLGSYRSRPMLSINRGFSAPVIVDRKSTRLNSSH